MDDRLPEQNEDLGFELRRYGRMLYRHRWWVLGTAAVVLIASIGLTMLRLAQDGSAQLPVSTTAATSPPPDVAAAAESSTRVLIEPPPGPAPVADFGTGDMPTHAQAIASTVVAEDVRARLDLSAPAPSLLEALSVIVESDSRVLRLTVTGDEFESRGPLPRAFAAAYLDRLQRQRRALLSRELRLLRDQSALIERQLATTTGDVSRASLVIRLVDVQGEIAATQLRRAALTPGRIVGPGFPDVEASPSPSPQPIDESTMPLVAPRPSLPRNSATGLLLGLLLGAAVGLTREVLDERLRTRRIVERALRLPVLLVHPHVPGEGDVSLERAYSILERMTRGTTTVVVTGFATSEMLLATARLLSDAARDSRRNTVDHTTTGDDDSNADLSIVAAAPLLESPEGTRLAAADKARMLLVIDGAIARLPEVSPVLAELRVGGIEPLGVLLYRGEEW